MVDNFDLIREYMTEQLLDWQEGDCYYVQLLRRQADDPLINGKKDPKYHGNMHSRSIKDYFIKSIDHLNDVEEDIKTLCNTFNVRAYIRLNKRNYKGVALQMLKHIAEQAASGETYSSPFHMVASAAGTSCAAGKDKTWLIDVDKEYLPYTDEIVDMILQCEPNPERIKNYQMIGTAIEKDYESAKKWYLEQRFFTVPTKNGLHIICPPFNRQTFQRLWDKSDNLKFMKFIDCHKDNPTILYVPDAPKVEECDK